MTRKRKHIAGWALACVIIVIPFMAQAPANAATAGGSCTKAGAKAKSGTVALVCTRVSGRLVWRRANAGGAAGQPSAGSSPVSWAWDHVRSVWAPSGTPPKCAYPIIPAGSLLDFGSAVSMVQPGQARGGSFKPHGGLRWSNYGQYVSGVRIKAPFDGVVTKAWHYTAGGTYQFGVDIISPCGFMVRLGHLRTPSPEFSRILATLPQAAPDDSRETLLNPPVAVKAGTVIATEVGDPNPANPDVLGTFADFGLVDLRAPNPAASSIATNAATEYASYSVCWAEGEYLAASDRAIAAALPFSNGDPASIYCRGR
jgi:hypothetical protein